MEKLILLSLVFHCQQAAHISLKLEHVSFKHSGTIQIWGFFSDQRVGLERQIAVTHWFKKYYICVIMVQYGNNLALVGREMSDRDVKFGIKIVLNWPQMGQIWDFLR